MEAALENIINYTQIIGLGVYSRDGQLVFNAGDTSGIAQTIDDKLHEYWLKDKIIYYNELYGGVFNRNYNKRQKNRPMATGHHKPRTLTLPGQRPESKKLQRRKEPKKKTNKVNEKRKEFKIPYKKNDERTKEKHKRDPHSLSMLEERDKKFIAFISTLEQINSLKNKKLPYDELVKLLSNIISKKDASIVARRLVDKELTFPLIRESLRDYFKDKYRDQLRSVKLGKIAVSIPIDDYNLSIKRNFWGVIGFNIFFFAGLLTLAFLWRAFLGIAQLKINLTLSEEQMNSLKDMNMTAAGLVHETKNPLGVVRGMAQLITAKKYIDAADKDLLEKIIEETDRVSSRLNQFLSYSKPRDLKIQSVNIESLINDIFAILEYDCEEKKVMLQRKIDPTINFIEADEEMLRQIIFNLLLNALQAVSENEGKITLLMKKDSDELVTIKIIDNGPGVEDKIKNDIFRPYFTGNESGTGLGLSIVKQLCLLHGWQIELSDNSKESGAVFKISGIINNDNK